MRTLREDFRRLKSDFLELKSDTVGKIALITTFPIIGISVWATFLAADSPTRQQSVLLGFAALCIFTLLTATITFLGHEYLKSYTVISVILIFLVIQSAVLVEYAQRGFTPKPAVTARYMTGGTFAVITVVICTVCGGLFRQVGIHIGVLGDQRTPEEKVLNDE